MKIKMIALSIVAMFSMGQTWPTFLGNPVIDQAEVLSPAAEQILYEKILRLETETSNEMAVVTVKSLEGYDIKDYSNRLFRHYGIGTKDHNNGVMLLIAPNDRKVRIEVGYGLEPILTDGQSSNIINYIILSAFKAGNVEEGVLIGTNEIINVINKPTAKFVIENPNTKDQDLSFEIFLVLFVAIGVGIIFIIYRSISRHDHLRDFNRSDPYEYPNRSISSTSKHNKTSAASYSTGLEESIYTPSSSRSKSSSDYSSSSSSSSDFGSSSSSSSDFGGGSSGGGGSDGSW